MSALVGAPAVYSTEHQDAGPLTASAQWRRIEIQVLLKEMQKYIFHELYLVNNT